MQLLFDMGMEPSNERKLPVMQPLKALEVLYWLKQFLILFVLQATLLRLLILLVIGTGYYNFIHGYVAATKIANYARVYKQDVHVHSFCKQDVHVHSCLKIELM